MEWLIRNRTVPFVQQPTNEYIAVAVDCRFVSCPLCSDQSLASSEHKLPILSTDPGVKRTVKVVKSHCVTCKITFSNTDLNSRFLEVNGNAYTVALLQQLHLGTIKDGHFASIYETLLPDTHVATHDAMIALRMWQELTIFESPICSECGQNPPMLFADVSGKRKYVLLIRMSCFAYTF